jgi:hypothetical protein
MVVVSPTVTVMVYQPILPRVEQQSLTTTDLKRYGLSLENMRWQCKKASNSN